VSPICQGATLSVLPTISLNNISGTWSPALNNQATTTYTFTPTAGQCAATTTLAITVNPQVTPTFNAVSPICQGATLSVLPTTSLNNIAGTWSPALNNQATTTYTFTPTAGQCTTSTTLTITVNPQVTPTFNAVSPICQGTTLSVLPTISLNGINGSWSPTLNNQATTTYTFTPTAGQCAVSTSITQTIIELPIAQFTVIPLDSVLLGSTLYFNNNSSFATQYSWYINDVFFSDASDPVYVTSNEDQFLFTLIASNEGCVDTFELYLPLAENTYVFAPNAFTPDEDEFNPTWKPYLSDDFDLENYHLLIFDRWGELIWESSDYAMSWDGTYGSDGRKVQDGTYTWILTIKKKQNDQFQQYSGTVMRIR
jgi:gliding motility-associated-like protein